MHYSEDIEHDPYMGSGTYVKKAFRKYGKNNFTREILFVFDTGEEASKKEREIVNEEFLKGHVYNVSLGGYGAGLIGELNPFYGRTHTDEFKQRMSDKRKGTKLTTEQKKKISDGLAASPTFAISIKSKERIQKMLDTKNKLYPKKLKEPKVKLTRKERGDIRRKWIENNKDKHKEIMNKINKDPEKIAKMVAKQTGRPKSEECKKNISKANMGKTKGIKNAEFIGYYIIPTGRFECLADAAKSFGCSRIAVRDRCRIKNDKKVKEQIS